MSLSPELHTRAMQMYAALPMSFEANVGQSDSRVKFLAHATGYSLFLTDQEAVLSPLEPTPVQKSLRAGDPIRHSRARQLQKAAHAVRVKFVGGNAAVVVAGGDELPAKSNYFIGNDPKQWHTNVPNYSAVNYHGIFPGVDAIFHGDNRRLEFDFDIAPGADPRSIALEVDGARRMRLNRAGNVVLGMDAAHKLVMNKPHIYQQLPEGRRDIAGNYVLGARNRIAFALGPYDHTRPLVIDPTLVYSTYLGGGGGESYAIAVDSSSPTGAVHGDPIDCSAGCAVVTGTAQPYEAVFPTTPGSYNPGPPPASGSFAFISKLKADGSGLVYSTFFGGVNPNGVGGDVIYAIAVDSTGAAYFDGISETEDNTPTTSGSFMPVRPSNYPVPFVAKLSPDGSTLVYSTYLDGSTTGTEDNASGIAVDSSFSAYVTGNTIASNFPTTTGAFQTVFPANYGEVSAFVTKLSADGSSLVYSTYLGGSESEDYTGSGAVGAIAVDSLNDAYVTGNTTSSNFPTKNPYIATCNSPCNDAFVSELNPTGTELVYSTFLGGTTANKGSVGLGIAVDPSNCTSLSVGESCSVFVGGTTSFTNFPVTSPVVQSSPGEGFITKLTPEGTGLVYSSYFNGSVESVAVGPDHSAVLFGLSNTALPFESTAGAFTLPACTVNGGCFFDFISKLTADGSGLLFSTPVGANLECCGATGALDPSGTAYITGSTGSLQLPTTAGSFEPTVPSTYSGFIPFVAKVSPWSSTSLTISPGNLPSGAAGEVYSPVTLGATGGTGTVTFAVTAGSPPPGMTLASDGVLSGTPTQTGTFPFTVAAFDSNNDTGSQAYSLVIECPTITVDPPTLAAGTSGTAYTAITFTEMGGVGTTTLSEIGALPTGMTWVAPVLSGTPTQTGSFPIQVTATDSNNCTGSVNPTLTINSASGGPANVTDNETITVTDTETFPDVVDSEPITVSDAVTVTPLINTLAGVPFAGPAAWYSTSGLGFNGASGETQTLTVSNVGEAAIVFSGAPQISSNSFTIRQTACSNGATSLPTTLPSGGACTFTVLYNPIAGAAATGTIVFTDNAALSSPPSAESGANYTQTISLNSAGSNAAPLSPPSATVMVMDNETITVADTETFPDVVDSEPITVTDSETVRAFSAITISPTPATFNASDGSAIAAAPYGPVAFTATGGTGTLTLTESGALPAGLIFSNGSLGGTLSSASAGAYTFSVKAADTYNDQTTVQGYTLNVAELPPSLMIGASPVTLTIVQGQSGQTTLTFTPQGGYSETLQLGCLGLPANTQCAFELNGAPITAVTVGNNQSVKVVLTIETDVDAMAAVLPASAPTPLRPGAILTAIAFWSPFSLLGLIALRRKRKLFTKNSRSFRLCLFVLLIGALAGLAGCISGGGFGTYVTPVGTSTVTVVVTPGSGSAQTVSIGVTITQQ
jgi:hypothetical protein